MYRPAERELADGESQNASLIGGTFVWHDGLGVALVRSWLA